MDRYRNAKLFYVAAGASIAIGVFIYFARQAQSDFQWEEATRVLRAECIEETSQGSLQRERCYHLWAPRAGP